MLLAASAVLFLHASVAAAGTLNVAFDTTPNGGNYAPDNVVSVWIESSAGAFVKTIGRWANRRRTSLVAWTAASGAADADAVSGATRLNHATRLTVTWDLKNRAGVEVPDGTYTIRMELADRNSTTAAQNHQGTFTFVKNTTGSTQTTAGGGFNNVAITYSTAASTCNNGRLDAGETCDPPGSCPSSCAVATDACMPNVLLGSASVCTAACVVQAVTECANADGCCPGACTPANDSDCSSGPGSDGQDLYGGCATGNHGAPVLLVLLGLGLVLLRRRAR